MTKEDTETTHTPDALLRELRALVAEAETLLDGAPSPEANDTFATLRERFEKAQDRLTGLYGDARKKAVDAAKRADTAVREHPYESLAIAAGVGLIIGLLLGRQSK